MKKTVLIKITFATLMIVAVMASGVAAQQQPQQSGPPLGTATSKSGSGSASRSAQRVERADRAG